MKRPRRTSTESEGETKLTDKRNNDDTTTSLNLLSAKNIKFNNFTSKTIDGRGDVNGNFSEMGFKLIYRFSTIGTMLRRSQLRLWYSDH